MRSVGQGCDACHPGTGFFPATRDRIDRAGREQEGQDEQGEAFHVGARPEVEVARAEQSHETHDDEIDCNNPGQQARKYENENAGDE